MPAIRTHKERPGYLEPVQIPKDFPHYEPLPVTFRHDFNLPLSAVLETSVTDAIIANGQIVFHCVGDTGGYHGTDVQEAVALAMEEQIKSANPIAKPTFFYHLGDVVYFNGQSSFYHDQFYEPYKFYPAPIFAIAGNHDGNPRPLPGDPPDPEPSLFGFMQNFCDVQRHSVDNYRDTMTQPYVYWTLEAPFVSVIGLYGNVDGLLDGPGTAEQSKWLAEQIKAADPEKCLIVAVHQPCYSLDGSHSGYPYILQSIDKAAADAGRLPDVVLSGHVHNYQRFTRTVGAKSMPYIVAGSGGYANSTRSLHRLQRDPADAAKSPVPCPVQTMQPGVELKGYNEVDAGFLRVIVNSSQLKIDYFAVPLSGHVPPGLFDSVTLNYLTGEIADEMNPGLSGAAP